MVAEPVLAATDALRLAYHSVCGILNSLLQMVNDSLPSLDQVFNMKIFSILKSEDHPPPQPQEKTLDRLSKLIQDHKLAFISCFATSLTVSTYLLYNHINTPKLKNKLRRRVPKLANGARRDVVLVVGSPTEPMTRLIAVDFEKRGFIVYLTILDDKDYKYIQSNQITDDINYLNLVEDTYDAHLAKFRKILHVSVVPFPGADAHYLRLSAVVFAPTLYFPLGPLENMSEPGWQKLLFRLNVTTKLLCSGLLDIVREQESSIVAIVPSIVSSLRMPYHGPESVLQNSMKDIFTTLAKELRPQNINVTQVRLGNLNLATSKTGAAIGSDSVPTIVEAEIRLWSEEMRSAYGSDFLKSQAHLRPMGSSFKSKGLRELYHVLFDLIFYEGRSSSVVYCGTGARAYDRLVSFLPNSMSELIF